MVLFSLIGWTPSADGRSDFSTFSCQLNYTICAREYELVSFLWHENLLCVESPRMNFRRVQKFPLLNVCDEAISFPDSLRTQRISNEDAQKGLFAKQVESCLVFRKDRMIFDHRPKRELLAHKMVLHSAVHVELSRPIRGLERCADNSNMPWNKPTIFHPGWTEEVSRLVLLSPCILPALHCHSFRNDGTLKYNDSIIDLHRLCQIPANCLCKSLLDWLSAREPFGDSFPFTEKSLFCTDKPVTIQ